MSIVPRDAMNGAVAEETRLETRKKHRKATRPMGKTTLFSFGRYWRFFPLEIGMYAHFAQWIKQINNKCSCDRSVRAWERVG